MMSGMLLLYGVYALSVLGGIVIARAGVHSAGPHPTGPRITEPRSIGLTSSTIGILACVAAIAAAAIVVTSGDLLEAS